jgi:hypothetical protein
VDIERPKYEADSGIQQQQLLNKERITMNTLKRTLIIMLLFLFAAPLLVQADEEAELQRQIVGLQWLIVVTQKKLTVLQNVQFTEQEKSAFWPVYDQYQDALFKVNQRSARLIADFAGAYKTLSDEQAQNIVREYLDIEKERVQLKESFRKKFAKVLPPKKVMRYLQIENKLETIARYKLAKAIPLAK